MQESLDVYLAPCKNRCANVLALQSGADRVRLQGLRAKKAYIAAAGKMNAYDAKVIISLLTFRNLSHHIFWLSALG